MVGGDDGGVKLAESAHPLLVLKDLRKFCSPISHVCWLIFRVPRLLVLGVSSFILRVDAFLAHPPFARWHSSLFHHEFHQIRLPIVRRSGATITTSSAYEATAARPQLQRNQVQLFSANAFSRASTLSQATLHEGSSPAIGSSSPNASCLA